MRRFYASPDRFANDTISLPAEETRHLRNVLRLHEGDDISVFDGNGREFHCVIHLIARDKTELRILNEIVPPSPESTLNLTLAVALLKGDKFDYVIQKAVELGVTEFCPIITRRCDAKSDKPKADRREKIAVEAAKQCGRARLMKIHSAMSFSDFAVSAAADIETSRVLFCENGGTPFSTIMARNSMIAAIGPEGGWDEAELVLAAQNNWQLVTLGGRILRSETAAISITAILQHSFGDVN